VLQFAGGLGLGVDVGDLLLLLYRVEKCEIRSYANQSEPGEARAAGSNSEGRSKVPLACK
jgi:hypothetical protein